MGRVEPYGVRMFHPQKIYTNKDNSLIVRTYVDDLMGIGSTEGQLDQAGKSVEKRVGLGKPSKMLGMELHWASNTNSSVCDIYQFEMKIKNSVYMRQQAFCVAPVRIINFIQFL